MKICTILGRREENVAEFYIKAVCDQLKCQYIEVKGVWLHDNRNICVEYADGDDILFWDSDIVADVEDVEKLRNSNLDIVSGSYEHRGKSGMVCCTPDLPLDSFGLHELDYCGAGFLFIKKEVFQKLNKPYFFHYPDEPGEDIYFCREAKKAGFKVYVDCDCKVLHI